MITVNRANTGWQNAQQSYQQTLQQRRGGMVLGYREKIRPFARRVAEARGLTIVLTTADNVLLSQPSVDITNEVIDQMQKAPAEVKAPAPVAAPVAPVTPPAAPAATK